MEFKAVEGVARMHCFLLKYIPWNSHEPYPGKYDFTGNNDLVRFIKLAQQNGLLVIIRAGPYICAEWEFGGFPGWLLKNRSIILRSSKDPNYLKAVDSWMSVLLTKLKPLLYANGGPIISVQVENEYGSYYTCDTKYKKHLHNTFEKYLGKDVILFTTDGYSDRMLKCGSLPSLYTTVDFGSGIDPSIPFKQQRKHQTNGPLVNSEYYTGWLDHWGAPHQRVDGKQVAEYLDKILAMNASVNMYMFEGGTNFGFMNGANYAGIYAPQPTSYDYDAPLSEAGDPTEKYFLIQKVISKYVKIPPGPVPKPTPKTAYGKFQISKKLFWLLKTLKHENLFIPRYGGNGFGAFSSQLRNTFSLMFVVNQLFPQGPPVHTRFPLSMEDTGQNYGFLLYEAQLPSSLQYLETVELGIKGLRDRAYIMVDQVYQGHMSRNQKDRMQINNGRVLHLLVENQGRINYGSQIHDPKGILGNVTYGGKILENWGMYPLSFSQSQIQQLLAIFSKSSQENVTSWVPSFSMAQFTLSNITDTYLKLDGWSKGQAFLNSYNLGRYWPAVGPQKTLYVPSYMLQSGGNTTRLILFEQDRNPCEKSRSCYVEFVDKPILG